MRILVAGATGVIGRVLIPLLASSGHEIAAFSRHGSFYDGQTEVRYLTADVFDRDGLFTLLERESPEIVVHLLTDLKEQSSSANARIRDVGTRNLVDAAKAVGTSKMVAQSIAWAYEPGDGAATESTSLDYDASQPRRTTIEGIVSLERSVSEMRRHTILRLGTLYGTGTWYDRDGAIAQAVQKGSMVASRAITNFLHVTDAAAAFAAAIEWPDGPVNVTDDEPASALVWLPAYARELNAPAPEEGEDPVVTTRAVSSQRAHSLGFRPPRPSWRAGFLS